MYYVYVLYSETIKKKYIGYTTDLEKRIEQHNDGFPGSFTNGKGPWILIYSEIFGNSTDALKREKYFKTS